MLEDDPVVVEVAHALSAYKRERATDQSTFGEARAAVAAMRAAEAALIPAGTSDKYGLVYVSKIGNTGFDDQREPVALLRAQDRLALPAMREYSRLINRTKGIPTTQRESVVQQVLRFHTYQVCCPDRVRLPGTPASTRNEAS